MRPRLKTILILLVIGAGVNVVVAWLPLKPAGMRLDEIPADEARRIWGRYALPEWETPRPLWAQGARGVTWSEDHVREWNISSGPAPPPAAHAVFRLRAGWPMRSFEGGTASNGQHWNSVGCVSVPVGGGAGFTLVTAPKWPGFAVNTVFFATLLWLALLLRRLIRIRRGLCPACAYPVGESDVCTECGGKLKHHRATSLQ